MPCYILQKPSGYYFRFRLPADVKELVSKSELRYSLQTGSIKLARSKARLIAGTVQSIIRIIRRDTTVGELTTEQIDGLIRKHIKEVLEKDERDRIMDDSPFDRSFHEGHLKILGMAKELVQDRLATKDNEFITETVDNLLQAEDTQAGKNSFAYKLLCREMFKAEGHILEVMRKRQAGDYSHETAPELPRVPPKKSKTISAVMGDFFEEGSSENRWRPKTIKEVKASMQLLIDYFGDVPINTIDRAMMGQYRRDLAKLPPNMNKDTRYRDLTVHQVLKLEPKPTITVLTISKYMSRATALLEYAKNNGEMAINPADGITVRKTQRKDEARDMFTTADLEKIFSSDDYINDSFRKSYQFWGPILALYTGARLEEIGSLHLNDFQEHEGVWCISINTEGDKQLKNSASKRIIPMHPYLIDSLGIIRRVERLKAINKRRFFADLGKSGDRYGTYLGRWFNERYKVLVGVTDKEFHSFRHTFSTVLSHSGIDDHSLKALMGHAEDSITFGTYVKRGAPQRLLADLEQHLNFGINLDHLKGSRWVTSN
nr:site-specific integrase [Desulfobacula sp.]